MFRILQAVAIGRTRPGEIAEYARVAVERPLKWIVALGLLERRVPALDHPARTKRAVYRIIDPYFAFWFRFIAPNRAHIARGLGAPLVDHTILPHLDDHMGNVFEDMARDHARWLAAAGEIAANRVESWWSADGAHEIDLVGVTGHDAVSFVGSVKWSAAPLQRGALSTLEQHALVLPGYRQDVPRLLYGRGGCDESVAAAPGVRCFSCNDMYAGTLAPA